MTKLLWACVLCAGLSACASQPVLAPSEKQVSFPQQPDGGANYWWRARFKMSWPEQESIPDFASNLIVANEVIVPVLRAHADEIRLWRFHRRAARDAAGHQFSFIFYSSAEAARKILPEIRSNPVLEELADNGTLLEVKLWDPEKPGAENIASTSDPDWPPSIRMSWPYFIMGVSVMFLEMLEREIDQGQLARMTTLPERLDYYAVVNDRLTELWRTRGRHAFFHHISGIFGYEPIDMRF